MKTKTDKKNSVGKQKNKKTEEVSKKKHSVQKNIKDMIRRIEDEKKEDEKIEESKVRKIAREWGRKETQNEKDGAKDTKVRKKQLLDKSGCRPVTASKKDGEKASGKGSKLFGIKVDTTPIKDFLVRKNRDLKKIQIRDTTGEGSQETSPGTEEK